MAAPSNLASLLAPGAKQRNLDLQALLAITGHEGASGGIGDGGHAFGPFQLNDAGGVLTGKLGNLSAQQKNAWAWSPAGIRFALDGIANVASGLHGADAVRSIASRYERPANVQAEINDALAHYGKSGTSVPSRSAPLPAAPSSPAGSSGLDNTLAGLIGSVNESLGLGGSDALQGLLGSPTAAPKPRPVRMPIESSGPTPTRKGGLAELLLEGTGGPTHSTGPHVHAAFTDPNQELAAIAQAQRLGLNVRENPYTDPVDPVHAPNSYHTRNFPGKYNGRTLGEAIDVSGPAQQAFYKWLQGQR